MFEIEKVAALLGFVSLDLCGRWGTSDRQTTLQIQKFDVDTTDTIDGVSPLLWHFPSARIRIDA